MKASFTEMHDALEAGYRLGLAQAVGAVFYGAGPEAAALGYDDSRPELRRLFISGFLYTLPKVVTDRAGRIVALEPKGR